jgi:hypothetical protein
VDFFLAPPLQQQQQQQQQQWGIGLTVKQLRKIVLLKGHMLRGKLSTLRSSALWLLNEVVSLYALLCCISTPWQQCHLRTPCKASMLAELWVMTDILMC